MTNEDSAQSMQKEAEKVQAHVSEESHRVEKEINDQFSSLKHPVSARKVDTSNPSNIKSFHSRIDEIRVFLPRDSLLTELFRISHIESLRNVFIAIMIILVLQVSINDIIQDGQLDLDFDLIFQSFAKLHLALFIWFIMKLSTALLIFSGFYAWMTHRKCHSNYNQTCTVLWLLIYFSYAVLFLLIPARHIARHQLGVASASIVLLEQLRQLMKAHSFIRENVSKVLSAIEPSNNHNTVSGPDFSHYLYFLFAPTLIYRDEYPRNSKIDWTFVLEMFGQVFAAIIYVYYVVIRFCVPTFIHLNQTEITLSTFVSVLFNSILPGSLFLLLIFYGLLHCWLNAFAEMLRFADRMFYQDWWNSTSFAAYFRTWNIVVHDWLYAYVYRDIYVLTGRRTRVIPAVCVIFLSAVFHEYVMMFALGFFYPVVFLLFGVVGLVLLLFVPRNGGVVYNVFFWLFILVGGGLQSCLYFMEAYARKSCPPNDTFWDQVIPRSFTCRIVLPSGNFLHLDL